MLDPHVPNSRRDAYRVIVSQYWFPDAQWMIRRLDQIRLLAMMWCARAQTLPNIALPIVRTRVLLRDTCRFRQAKTNFSWNGARRKVIVAQAIAAAPTPTLQGSVRDAKPRSQSGATFFACEGCEGTTRACAACLRSSPLFALGHWLTQDNALACHSEPHRTMVPVRASVTIALLTSRQHFRCS